jgi:hypothetical protein
MALLEFLTDDQIALIGCAVALAVSFALMSLTWTVREAVKPAAAAASILEQARRRKQQQLEEQEQQRRAA